MKFFSLFSWYSYVLGTLDDSAIGTEVPTGGTDSNNCEMQFE